MRPIRRAILPALCGSALLTGFLHNHLVKSEPAAGARLAQSPREIRLWFAERPEVAFTSVTLMKGDSTRLATIRAVATEDSMAVAIPLASPLPPGDYLVGWRSASTDGHAVRGTFGFSISP
jgi:methionine-rich copper-binding protein CopC